MSLGLRTFVLLWSHPVPFVFPTYYPSSKFYRLSFQNVIKIPTIAMTSQFVYLFWTLPILHPQIKHLIYPAAIMFFAFFFPQTYGRPFHHLMKITSGFPSQFALFYSISNNFNLYKMFSKISYKYSIIQLRIMFLLNHFRISCQLDAPSHLNT